MALVRRERAERLLARNRPRIEKVAERLQRERGG